MEESTFSIRKALSFGWITTFEHIWLFIKIAFTFLAIEFVLLLGYLPILALYHFMKASTSITIPTALFIGYYITVGLVFFTMAYLGLPRIMLDLYERNASSVSRMFTVSPYLLSFIGASLLVWLLFTGPSILFSSIVKLPDSVLRNFSQPLITIFLFAIPIIIISIFVGFYIGFRLMFYSLTIIDKRMGTISCLQYSWKITQGSVLKILLFSFVFVLMLCGLFALVGLNVFGLTNALNGGWYSLAFIFGLLLAVSLLFIILVFSMFMLAQTYVYKKLSLRSEHQTRE